MPANRKPYIKRFWRNIVPLEPRMANLARFDALISLYFGLLSDYITWSERAVNGSPAL